MKTLTFFLLICLVACKNQTNFPTAENQFGTWAIGSIKTRNWFNIYKPYHIDGYQVYFNWSEIEPTQDNYNWAAIDEDLKAVADVNIFSALQIQVGQNCPEWIFTNVPKVYTAGGNDNGPYPYYFDEYYKTRYFLLLKKVADHLNNLPTATQAHFVYWQIAEGSTGDEQPYKGTPLDDLYNIDFYDWQNFKLAVWDSVELYAGANKKYKFLFNDGNDGTNVQYVDQHFPHDFHKDGFLSHSYSFNGEALYHDRQYLNINDSITDNRGRGEIQDIYDEPWWSFAPVKQAFALSCSAAANGLDMLNLTPGYINSINNDTRPADFFDRYAGYRHAQNSKRGFIALRDCPDFADSIRFPAAQYGAVIDPAKKRRFDNRINAIWANRNDSVIRKQWLTMQTYVIYLNPARVENIAVKFHQLGAEYDERDFYHNDFGVYMNKNWSKFITQYNPDSTSYGAWRLGDDSCIYGRYARYPTITNGKGGMYFSIDDSLIKPKDKFTITVTYYDNGNGQWALNCSNQSLQVTNTNTNEWLQRILTVNSYKPNSVFNGRADFALRYQGGDNTAFTLIEIKNEKQ
jgi:hypothetical protein